MLEYYIFLFSIIFIFFIFIFFIIRKFYPKNFMDFKKINAFIPVYEARIYKFDIYIFLLLNQTGILKVSYNGKSDFIFLDIVLVEALMEELKIRREIVNLLDVVEDDMNGMALFNVLDVFFIVDYSVSSLKIVELKEELKYNIGVEVSKLLSSKFDFGGSND